MQEPQDPQDPNQIDKPVAPAAPTRKVHVVLSVMVAEPGKEPVHERTLVIPDAAVQIVDSMNDSDRGMKIYIAGTPSSDPWTKATQGGVQ